LFPFLVANVQMSCIGAGIMRVVHSG
jgi:hypothetical protein